MAGRYLAIQGVVAALAFASIWLWVAVMPLACLDPEYPVWRAKLSMLRQCDLGDLLIVGDSRAAVDLIPALLPIRATNLAVGGGMPVEAFIAVSRALACPVPPKRVVISIDAAHFVIPDLFWERSVKYGFAAPADLVLLRQTAAATHDPSLATPQRPDGLTEWLRGWLFAWRFPPLYAGSLLRGGVFLRLWRNQATYAATLAARGQYFFGRDDGSDIVAVEGHMPAFVPRPLLDRYFDRLLTLLEVRGIPVDFVAMPMNESTARAVSPEVRAAFAAYLAGCAARHPGFHVLGPVMPAWPNRYFGDGFSHLNPAGATLLSREFGQYLAAASAVRSARRAE